MPDWVGAEGEPTAERYRRMAEHEVRGISPAYEVLCARIAGDDRVLGLLDTLPPPKRQPNLLLAAVRFLDGPIGSWDAFRAFVVERWSELATTMAQRRTQTNEPGRCSAFLPSLAALDTPIALIEVGASAGLCLFPDRWSYRYATPDGTRRFGTGPELGCTATGPVPWPSRMPEIVWRAGLDLHPLDVSDGEDVRWLQSLIWPEQAERFARLSAAVAIARADPPRIVTGDLLSDLPELAAQAPPGAMLVIVHSAVLAYVPTQLRAGFVASVDALSSIRPTVWLSNEAPGVVAGTDQPPGAASRFVLAQDGVPLARTGPHGQSLDWLS